MALVAPAQPTGFSGFWQYHAPAGQTAPYNFRFFRSSEEFLAATSLDKRGYRKYRAQIRALIGVAPGATSVDSYKRVQAVQAMNDPQYLGGLRTLQTINNGVVTTAGMVTAVNARVLDQNFNATQPYPRDASGNGGGGKGGR